MKKILVLGIKGMAGHVMFRKLQQNSNFQVYGAARNIESIDNVFNLDVEDTKALRNIYQEHSFDFVINCIGILNKDAEDHPAKSIWFNSYFPHFLEEMTRNSSTQVIHISTDCVFNGKKGNYTETDIKDGFGFYAQSKALGEIVNDKDLTIRTSIIGPELNPNGIGLFHWFMTQPLDSKLKGYSQAFWSGITTIELANVVEFVINNKLSGLINISPEKKISKFHLLQHFNEIFRNNNLKIGEFEDYQVDKSLISERSDFDYQVPDYKQMLFEMKQWMETSMLYQYS